MHNPIEGCDLINSGFCNIEQCQGDKLTAARLANDIFLSLKSRPVEVRPFP